MTSIGFAPAPLTPQPYRLPDLTGAIYYFTLFYSTIPGVAGSPGMSSPPPPAAPPPPDAPSPSPSLAYAQPCVLNAIMSALPSGVIGWVLGVLPSMFRNVGLKHARTWLDDGARSGSNLMIISGAYSLSHCIISRIRQADDAFDRGAAGCMTGLAVGWSAGPSSALQSCLGIGLISYVVDLGGSEQPAKASTSTSTTTASRVERARPSPTSRSATGSAAAAKHASLGSRAGRGRDTRTLDRLHAAKHKLLDAAALHRLPPVMWLGAVCGQGYLSTAAAPWDLSRS